MTGGRWSPNRSHPPAIITRMWEGSGVAQIYWLSENAYPKDGCRLRSRMCVVASAYQRICGGGAESRRERTSSPPSVRGGKAPVAITRQTGGTYQALVSMSAFAKGARLREDSRIA